MKFINTLNDIFKNLLWDLHDIVIEPFKFPHSDWKINIIDNKVIYSLKIPNTKKEDIEMEMIGNTISVKIKDENTDSGKVILEHLLLPHNSKDELVDAYFINDTLYVEKHIEESEKRKIDVK